MYALLRAGKTGLEAPWNASGINCQGRMEDPAEKPKGNDSIGSIPSSFLTTWWCHPSSVRVSPRKCRPPLVGASAAESIFVMDEHYDRIALVAATHAVGLVFAVAGIGKLSSRRAFERSVEAYGLLPKAAIPAVALLLPWIEVAIGISLLLRWMEGPAASLALGLLVAFISAQIKIIIDKKTIPCGCFGGLTDRPVGWDSVLTNSALAACSILVVFACVSARSPWLPYFHEFAGGSRWLPAADDLLARLVTTGLLVQFLLMNQIVENTRLHKADVQYLDEVSKAVSLKTAG